MAWKNLEELNELFDVSLIQMLALGAASAQPPTSHDQTALATSGQVHHSCDSGLLQTRFAAEDSGK